VITLRPAVATIAIAVAPFIFGGCNSSDIEGGDCLAIPVPAIRVVVLDSVTLQPGAMGATGTIQAGGYSETLQLNANALVGAFDRYGVYDVQVTKPGYRSWTQSNVRAEKRNRCGSSTEVRALLQPL
jgi:hypothetical protein